MDIKLKNNKAKSLFIAIAIVAVAAVSFVALYPSFGERARYYYKGEEQNEELLYKLCESNYVLFKNIQESVQGKRLDFQDVYTQITEEKATEEEIEHAQDMGEKIWDPGDYESEEGMRSSMLSDAAPFLSRMEDWEKEFLDSLYREIDYCVLDQVNGKLLKNTDRGIEQLIRPGAAGNPYLYFISMTYDEGGNVTNVSVTGENSDSLLKSLQAKAQSSRPEAEEKICYLDDGRKVSIQVRRPSNTIFMYGFTQEQWESLNGIVGEGAGYVPYMQNWWTIYRAYSSAGVTGYYTLFLLAVFFTAVLLPKIFRSYSLHESRLARVPLEVAAVVCIILLAAQEWVTSLIMYSNQDMLLNAWNRIAPRSFSILSAQYPGYLILKFTMNLMPVILLFTGAFWAGTSIGAAWNMGFMAWMKERSLIYRFWLHTKDFWKARWKQFKESMLSVDLSKDTEKIIIKVILVNFLVLSLLSCLWFFGIGALVLYSVVIFLLIRKYVEDIQLQYKELLKMTHSIAQGNLNTPMEMQLGIFEACKAELMQIQDGFRSAVDEEVKSQKMKTELITNVSHDLKTPLTAIITYIDLLKDSQITPEQKQEYLNTLEKKSLRLKVLIEDLFEVSKADSKNVTLNPVPLDICNLIMQVYLEYEDKMEQQRLELRFRMPEEKIILNLDSQKTYRIFENLYLNISKYAMPGTRVYVNVEKEEDGACIEMKNISANELNVNPSELTERFVRGDSARNTEGSGLGLAIASSFVELQGGSMKIEIDGDLYKVKIKF